MSFDTLLQQTPPGPKRPLNRDFTRKTISVIETKPRVSPSAHARKLYERYVRLPRLVTAVLALGIIAGGGTAAYAAVNWLIPKVTVLQVSQNDDQKREFIMNIKDCGVMVGGQTADNGTQRYEVAKNAGLNDEQVIKVIENSCKYQQLLENSPAYWKDNSNYGAGASNALNDPAIGIVSALSRDSITITSTLYREYNGPSSIPAGQPIPDFDSFIEFFPEGKKLERTFSLAASADVLENGKSLPLDQLKVGDQVFFLTASKPRTESPEEYAQLYDKHGLPATVAHLIKTDIDPQYVQPLGSGKPSIVNAVARLKGCQGNGSYLCLDYRAGGLRPDFIYATSTQELPGRYQEMFKNNDEYFRKDIDLMDPKASDAYREIEGRIIKIDGTSLQLRSRGKVEVFTILLPYDAINTFNKNAAHKAVVGSYIKVNYFQRDGEDRSTIKANDLTGLQLLTRQIDNGSYLPY